MPVPVFFLTAVRLVIFTIAAHSAAKLNNQGDTYFSGKMLAKLGRVLVIAEEMGFANKHHTGHDGKKSNDDHDDDYDDDNNHHHGNKKVMEDEIDAELFHQALQRLQAGVAVWLDGQADSPMVFDSAWGGVFGCGCDYQPPQDGQAWDEGSWCENVYPNCPSVVDAGIHREEEWKRWTGRNISTMTNIHTPTTYMSSFFTCWGMVRASSYDHFNNIPCAFYLWMAKNSE